MGSRSALAGIGSIAFSVLTIVGLFLANAPGGSYDASDAVKYVAKGHRVEVIASLYIVLLAVLGLFLLLAYLRDLLSAVPDGERIARLFWGLGIGAATSFAVGWSIVLGDAIAHAFGGSGVVIDPAVTFLVSELGYAAVFGPGAVLLGFALIAFVIGGRTLVPAWLRWSTLVAALAAIVSLAFFPSALVVLWGIVMGIWLLVAGREPAVATPANV
jgi:hypothetical protein